MNAIAQKCALTFLLALLSLNPLYGADTSSVSFLQRDLDFGKVVRGVRVESEFILRNEATSPLGIRKIAMTEPLRPLQIPSRIGPGEQASIRVGLDTSQLQGAYEGEILVFLDDARQSEVVLSVRGQIVSSIELAPMPAFFVAAQRGEAKEAAIEIINHESEPVHIEGLEHATDRFTTRLETLEAGQHYRLHLRLKPDSPGGQHSETILIRTSSKTHPVLRVAANTFLHERVYTFPDTVHLGAMRLSDIQAQPELLQRLAQTLMVYQSGRSDFQIKLNTDLSGLRLASERGPQGDRHQITISLLKEQVRTGPIEGSIVIETNDPEFPRLVVPVTGHILRGSSPRPGG